MKRFWDSTLKPDLPFCVIDLSNNGGLGIALKQRMTNFDLLRSKLIGLVELLKKDGEVDRLYKLGFNSLIDIQGPEKTVPVNKALLFGTSIVGCKSLLVQIYERFVNDS